MKKLENFINREINSEEEFSYKGSHEIIILSNIPLRYVRFIACFRNKVKDIRKLFPGIPIINLNLTADLFSKHYIITKRPHVDVLAS